MLVSWRQRGHRSWNAGHRSLDGPRADPVPDRLGQLVDGQLGIGERVADGRDDLVGLLGREADRLRMQRHRRRQGRQRARPHREVGGGQQVDGAARAERLDQRAIDPERALHVGTRRAGDAPRDRELGGLQDLGVRSAQHAGDVGGAGVRGRLDERVAGHPPAP